MTTHARRRRGLLKGELQTVPISRTRSRKVRLFRYGDVKQLIVSPEKGDTHERFRIDGVWMRTKLSAATMLGRTSGAAFDALCGELGLDFEKVRSPVTGMLVLAGPEQDIKAAQSAFSTSVETASN